MVVSFLRYVGVSAFAFLAALLLFSACASAAGASFEPVVGSALDVHWVVLGVYSRGVVVLPAKAPIDTVSGLPGVVQLARVELRGDGSARVVGLRVEQALGGMCVRGSVVRVLGSLVVGSGGGMREGLEALINVSVVDRRDAGVYRFLVQRLPARSAVVLLASGYGVDPGRWLRLLGGEAGVAGVRLVAVGSAATQSSGMGVMSLYDFLYTQGGVERVGKPAWLLRCGVGGRIVSVVACGVVIDASEPLHARVWYLLSARIEGDRGAYIVVGYGGARGGECLAVRRVDAAPVNLTHVFEVGGYRVVVRGSSVLLETGRGEVVLLRALGSRVSVVAPCGWVLYVTRGGVVAVWADERGIHASVYRGGGVEEKLLCGCRVTLAAVLVGWAGPVPVAVVDALARGVGGVLAFTWPWSLVDENGDMLVDVVDGVRLPVDRVCVRLRVEAFAGGERLPLDDPRVPDALLAALLHGGPGNATRCAPIAYSMVTGARLGARGIPSGYATLSWAARLGLCDHLSPRQAPRLRDVRDAIAGLVAYLVGGRMGRAPLSACPPGAEALIVLEAGLYEDYFDGMGPREAALATTWGHACSAYLEAALGGDNAALEKLAECLTRPPETPDPLAYALYTHGREPSLVARAAWLLVTHAAECGPETAAIVAAKAALRLHNCSLAEAALRVAREYSVPSDTLRYVEQHARLACGAYTRAAHTPPNTPTRTTSTAPSEAGTASPATHTPQQTRHAPDARLVAAAAGAAALALILLLLASRRGG